MPGFVGEQCCAPGRFRAKPCALRLPVQRGAPVPRRQATPPVRIEDSACESWPRPSQTLAQQGPPYSSACRVIFHRGQTVMTTDIVRCLAADQSGNHFQCCLVRRKQPQNSGERLRRCAGPFRIVGPAAALQDGETVLSAVTAPLLVAEAAHDARQKGEQRHAGGHGRAPVSARSTASCSRSDHDIPWGRERARSLAIARSRSRSSSDSAASAAPTSRRGGAAGRPCSLTCCGVAAIVPPREYAPKHHGRGQRRTK